jgi:ABC-type multidrug transport system fused ATPase/permease subunit
VLQKLPQEGTLKAPTGGSPSNWPADGRIDFNNFDLRYSSSSPLVLNDVTFSVKPAEKVGVVGRTGAGISLFTYSNLTTIG